MVKVVFLAGGIGKRMQPILADKCLLKFCGRELILHQLDLLKSVGLSEVIIIASPSNIEQIRAVCAGYPGLKLDFAIQKEAKGMADALLSAEELIGDSEFLVVGANEIFEASAYRDVLLLAEHGTSDAYILGYRVSKYFPGGYLLVKGDDIRGIVEKPGEGNEPSDLVNLVFHLHKHPSVLFDFLKRAKTKKDDQYEVAIDSMIKAGYKYRAVPYSGAWVPIKYPWHIHNAMEHFIRQRGRFISDKASISDTANIVGDVIIEEGVKVFENATIRGPCYVGKGAVIGNYVLLWNFTHIGEHSVVGYGSEIKHSYIGENCWFHSNYVGDSIVMDGSSFGSGTVTANFRFDEESIKVKVGDGVFDTCTNKFGCIIGEGCKIGVNVSIYPGRKIGAGSMIGPGVVVSSNVEPVKLVSVKQKLEVSDNPIKLEQSKKAELMKKLVDGTHANPAKN